MDLGLVNILRHQNNLIYRRVQVLDVLGHLSSDITLSTEYTQTLPERSTLPPAR